MRIVLALLVVAVCVYLVVRLLQRRVRGGTSEAPPALDPAAEEAWRQALRERADRQRRGVPEPAPPPAPTPAPPLVEMADDVFESSDDMESMAEYFVVSSSAPTRKVVAAVDRASERFMLVDENGVEHPDAAGADAARFEGLYTPNYVATPRVTRHGVEGYVDCKGVIEPAMGQRFRLILSDELAKLGTPSRVVTRDP